MTLAWLSLGALLAAIVLSCATKLNVGLVSIVLAWIIGVYVAPALGKPLALKEVVAGFPGDLFLTLTGVTLLFAQAQVNGTLERAAHHAVRLCRGNAGLVPVIFFVLALLLGSLGAGNIAAAALLGPLAMAAAARAGIPAFLMTIMVAHGSMASALSPISPTGIVAADRLARVGLEGLQWTSYWSNLAANAAVALAGYLLFGGWKLFRKGGALPPEATGEDLSLRGSHWATIGVVLAVVAAVVLGNALKVRIDVGMAAFAAAVLLSILGLADEGAAVRAVPWGVLLMVCGVTVLTELLFKTGGMDLFTTLLARLSTPAWAPGAMALVVGLVSVYSSTVGVVLPTFLPTVRDLVAKMGGGDPVAIAMSILVGGHLVDVSPLSTIGALCVAGVTHEDKKKVFNRVLAWGLSMAVVGALFCQLFFG
jgi:di/tricarboxylate transporter